MSLTKPTREPAIDFLRALSMLYIVGFWHLFNYTTAFPEYANIFTGRLVVIILGLFIFISGYLIGTKHIGLNKALNFYKTRLLRIYPSFVIAAFLFYFSKLTDIPTVLNTITLGSLISQPYPPTIWFIPILLSYYIMAPLLLWTVEKPLKFSLTSVAIYSSLLALSYYSSQVEIRWVLYFPCFASGLYLANHKYLIEKINLKAVIFCLCITAYYSLNSGGSVEKSAQSFPLALSGSILIFVSAMRHRNRIKNIGILEFISYGSYFTYLFHRIIFSGIIRIYFPQSLNMQVLYLYLVCLPIVLFLSFWGQTYYDKVISIFYTKKA